MDAVQGCGFCRGGWWGPTVPSNLEVLAIIGRLRMNTEGWASKCIRRTWKVLHPESHRYRNLCEGDHWGIESIQTSALKPLVGSWRFLMMRLHGKIFGLEKTDPEEDWNLSVCLMKHWRRAVNFQLFWISGVFQVRRWPSLFAQFAQTLFYVKALSGHLILIVKHCCSKIVELGGKHKCQDELLKRRIDSLSAGHSFCAS